MKGITKFFGTPEADLEYWRSVDLFEDLDSNVPKADSESLEDNHENDILHSTEMHKN